MPMLAVSYRKICHRYHYGATAVSLVPYVRFFNSTERRSGRKIFDGDDNNSGFFRMGKDAIKKALPTEWFGTEEEKKALQRQKETKKKVENELNGMLQGAPLPLRLLGKVAGRVIGNVASNMVQTIEQNQQHLEKLLDEAQLYLINDAAVRERLGSPIQLARVPFQQSSSTIQINGQQQNRTGFSTNVFGSKLKGGVVRISASDEGIGQIIVEIDGKVYDVDISSNKATKRKSKKWFNVESDTNIIDGEILDKKQQ